MNLKKSFPLIVILIMVISSACGPTLATTTVPSEIATSPFVTTELSKVPPTKEPTTVPTETSAPQATETQVEKKVVTVWHGDNEAVARITEDLIESEFYTLYPDIEIKYELAPEPFQEKLLASIPIGTGPDLFEWNHDWIGTVVAADLIEPIDDLVSYELQEKYVPSAFQAGQYNGRLYTLPISAEAGALAYNKTMLGDQPSPKTTADLVSLMAALKPQGGFGISYPLVPFLVSGYVHAFGGWLWDDETKTLGVNSPETKAAIEWLVETFKPYMSSDPTWDPQVTLFNEKLAPFAINGPWMTGSWNDAGIDFGVMPLPEINELGKMPEPYTGVKSVYMTKNVRDKEAAFAFMVWATTSKERILQRAMQLGYIPVLNEVVDLPEIQNDPVISGFAAQVALGKPMSSSPEMVAVWGPFGDAVAAAFTGAKTVDQALDDAQGAIQEAIDAIQP